jgi:hypothetical protein
MRISHGGIAFAFFETCIRVNWRCVSLTSGLRAASQVGNRDKV